MIVFETINVAMASYDCCNSPYGFAVSDAETAEARLAEVRKAFPLLDIDERHVASVDEARELGYAV